MEGAVSAIDVSGIGTHIKQRPHSVRGARQMQDMLIPSMALIAERIGRVPPRETQSLAAIRAALAREFGADATCPVTTQRHLKAIAEEAVAGHAAGARDIVPFWRVVDPDTPNAARLAGGRDFILLRRAEEGF
jgi:hypothetical protein